MKISIFKLIKSTWATILFVLLPMFMFGQLIVNPIEGEQVVEHKAYMLSYNESCEQANWVLHNNTKIHLDNPVIKRKNYFKSDPLIITESAHIKDYTRSGYDRGHLAPAADMLWDTLAMKESFYMSNMSPQLPGFNRGVWKRLEAHVRDFSERYESVWVYSGPSLTTTTVTIGDNNVCIPTHYWKIVYKWDYESYWIVCYLLPHESSKADLSTFIVSITEVEDVTGYNFILK